MLWLKVPNAYLLIFIVLQHPHEELITTYTDAAGFEAEAFAIARDLTQLVDGPNSSSVPETTATY